MSTKTFGPNQKIKSDSDEPKYICPECKQGYWSIVPLSRLNHPFCEDCGEKLIRFFPLWELEERLAELIAKAIEGANNVEEIQDRVHYHLEHLDKEGGDGYMEEMKVGPYA